MKCNKLLDGSRTEAFSSGGWHTDQGRKSLHRNAANPLRVIDTLLDRISHQAGNIVYICF